MKNRSSKPPAEDENDFPDEGMWNHPDFAEEQWRDAPDEDEEIWELPTTSSEWQETSSKDEEEEKRKDGMIALPKLVETQYYPALHLVGYGFLGLSIFDHANIIYPAKINDPIWIV